MADSGGSNGARPRAFKKFLQERIADEYSLEVTVSHYPTGASKWNPIEHRMFSEISKNWAGHPLESFETLLNFTRNTKTETGLRIEAYLDESEYEKGIKVKTYVDLVYERIRSCHFVLLDFFLNRQNTYLAIDFIQKIARIKRDKGDYTTTWYFIASAAYDPTSITLVVTKVPEGLATTFIHEVLREGDEVSFNGPYGEFHLSDSEREIFFVATGSGLAPIMSILYQMAEEKITRKATLVFGARYRKDLFYVEEIEALKQKISRLEVFFTLSRPQEEDRWDGEKGRVTNVLEKIMRNGESKEAYLCGNPAMVESCQELLVKKGIPQELIFFDIFG